MTSIRSSRLLQPGRKASPGVGGLNGAASHLGHNFSDAVQFSGNTLPQSYWVRLRQGLQRLWQKVAGPFQRLTAWIQKNWTQKKVDPPASSGPKQSAAAPAAEASRVTGAPPPPLLTQDSNSHPVPRGPEGSGSVALDQTTDATSAPLEESAESSAQAITVPPSTPPETPVLPAPGTGETEEGVLCPAHEALNNARQGQDALQISGDAALAKQLAAEEARIASAPALTSDSPEGPATPPGGQAVSVGTTPPSIPVEALFGRDLTSIRFQQQQGNTCYLLSSLDAIFHHPQGKQILATIQIARTPGGYSVKFPGQPQAITVNADELGSLRLANGDDVPGVKSHCQGVRILECAYSKLPPHPLEPDQIFGEYQSSTIALEKIFGRGDNQSGQITLENIVGKPQLIGAAEFPYEERKIQLQEYLRSMAANTQEHRDFDVLTIIPRNGVKHYESIRLNQSTPEQIVTADPFDTEKKVKTIPIDELLDQYHIKGLRVYR